MHTAFLALCFLPLTMCWWERSHSLIAEIARLETDSKVHDDLFRILSLDNESLPFHYNWQQSSVFADELKTYKLFTMSLWHYIDTPIVVEPFPYPVIYPPTTDNAVWAGIELTNTMANSPSPWAVAFAIRYIFHLLGDLHQPLHAAQLFSTDFKKGDAGGNLFTIAGNFSGYQIRNLHALWDSCGANFIEPVQPIPFTREFLDKTTEIAKSVIQEYDITGERLETNWTSWAAESFEIAKEYVYTNISIGEKLDANSPYIARAREVCLRRVRLAGARLAYLLNTTSVSSAVRSSNDLRTEDGFLFRSQEQHVELE